MKLLRLGLLSVLCLALVGSISSPIHADSATTTVTLEIVSSPPSVTTNEVTLLKSPRQATLNGSLTSLGSVSTVVVYFEWGATTDYGFQTTEEIMNSTGDFNATIGGLSPATTYHFRAVAVDDDISDGLDMSFTTRGQWWQKLWRWFFSFL